MNETEIVELVEYINNIGSDMNGWIEYVDGFDIPKLQVVKYPPINTLMNNMDIPKYKFKTAFINKDSQIFDPSKLKFNHEFRDELDEHPLFIFSNGYGKNFLVYVGKNIIPEYIWEIDYNVPEEEEEPELEGGAEGGDEDMGDEF